MESFDNGVRKYLSFLDNEYVSAGLSLFLIVYASLAAPRLPAYIAKLFDYVLVKLVMFFLIVYISRKNPTVAIIAAVAVLVSLMSLNRISFNEGMASAVKNSQNNAYGNNYDDTNDTYEDAYERQMNQIDVVNHMDRLNQAQEDSDGGRTEGQTIGEEEKVHDGHPTGFESGLHSYQPLSTQGEEITMMQKVSNMIRSVPMLSLHQQSQGALAESKHVANDSESQVEKVLKVKSMQEEKLGRQLTENELKLVCKGIAFGVLKDNGDEDGNENVTGFDDDALEYGRPF